MEQHGCRGCGKSLTLKLQRPCAASRESDQRCAYSLIHLTLDLARIEPCGDQPACLARYRRACLTHSLAPARFKACGRQPACLARYRRACWTHSWTHNSFWNWHVSSDAVRAGGCLRVPVFPGQACGHSCRHTCVAAGRALLHPSPQRCVYVAAS